MKLICLVIGLTMLAWGAYSCWHAEQWSLSMFDIPSPQPALHVDLSELRFWVGQGITSMMLGAYLLFWIHKMGKRNIGK
jgi:hypothetical protein